MRYHTKVQGKSPPGVLPKCAKTCLFSDHTNAAFSISTIFETTDVIRCSDAYTSEKLQNFCVMYGGSGSRHKTTIFGVLCGRVFVHLFPVQQSNQLISGLYFCRYMDIPQLARIDIQGQGQKSRSIETTRVVACYDYRLMAVLVGFHCSAAACGYPGSIARQIENESVPISLNCHKSGCI